MTIATESRTLTRDDLHTILYWMRLTRAFDERVRLLYNQGRIPGAAFSQRGHEAISVGASFTSARTMSSRRCTATWARTCCAA